MPDNYFIQHVFFPGNDLKINHYSNFWIFISKYPQILKFQSTFLMFPRLFLALLFETEIRLIRSCDLKTPNLNKYSLIYYFHIHNGVFTSASDMLTGWVVEKILSRQRDDFSLSIHHMPEEYLLLLFFRKKACYFLKGGTRGLTPPWQWKLQQLVSCWS